MFRSGPRVRPERVAEQVRMEIAAILQRDLKDPRVGLATCTRVQITRDLKLARIYVSVLGTPEEQKRAMAALEGASGFVRRLLGQRLTLRASPEVRFLFDPSVEYGIKLERIIQGFHDQDSGLDAASQGGPAGEPDPSNDGDEDDS